MERGFAMRPRERRETSEQDLFRSRLDQIIDMKHALVKLGRAIDWRFLEERFGAVYRGNPQNRICKEIAIQRPKTGKFDYLGLPNHSTHSMAFEFFTDD